MDLFQIISAHYPDPPTDGGGEFHISYYIAIGFLSVRIDLFISCDSWLRRYYFEWMDTNDTLQSNSQLQRIRSKHSSILLRVYWEMK